MICFISYLCYAVVLLFKKLSMMCCLKTQSWHVLSGWIETIYSKVTYHREGLSFGLSFDKSSMRSSEVKYWRCRVLPPVRGAALIVPVCRVSLAEPGGKAG